MPPQRLPGKREEPTVKAK